MNHRRILQAFILVAGVAIGANGAKSTTPRRRKSSISGPRDVSSQKNSITTHFGSKKLAVATKSSTTAPSTSLVLSSQEISAVFGTVLTFVLNNYYALGPVQASSVTTLFVSLVLPEKLAIPAVCGSFAGMAKTTVIDGVKSSLILGCMCAIMLKIFDEQKWLVGVGGRLGFIAQCACTFQFVVTSFFHNPSESAALIGYYPKIGELISGLPLICLSTVVGAIFMKAWKEIIILQSQNKTYFQSVYKQLSTNAAAVGVTGLIATLLSPASIAGPVFCGSFISMSSPSKLSSWRALIIASLLGGLSQQLLSGVLVGGWGGKLGTASLSK